MKNLSLRRSLLLVALATGGLLLVPALAMQLTPEVAWGWMDFVAAAMLLFSAGMGIVLAITRIDRPARRRLVVLAIVVALALVWAELAVGLLG